MVQEQHSLHDFTFEKIREERKVKKKKQKSKFFNEIFKDKNISG